MKKINVLIILNIFFGALLISCNNEPKDLRNIEVKSTEKVELIDISKDYFSEMPLEDFKQKYPWFLGNIPDEDYEKRRKDSTEIDIYQKAIKGIDKAKLNEDLSQMFARVKHFFPTFKTPKVFLYSSSLEGITDYPVFFRTDEGMIFVDISAFMGKDSQYYEGLDIYLKNMMNPENILPQIGGVVAREFVIFNPQERKFLDMMMMEGKVKFLQDIFLPNIADNLKMDYTENQQQWAVANEGNIWNYFVENDLIFSDDNKLYERFMSVAPFSKFYTEIDQKSSPRVGTFIGWQIAKSFFKENPNTDLAVFLKMNATDIFNQSNYKPEN